VARVGRKSAVYISKRVMERLGVKEGDRVLMRVEGGRLALEFVPNPLSLALRVRKFEEESEAERGELYRLRCFSIQPACSPPSESRSGG